MPFPLIALATTLLPELVRLVAGDRAGSLAGTVAGAVRELTGTDEPEAARAAIERDPALATQLRLRLAEIALEQERLQRAAAEQERRAELETLQARMADLASARGTMLEMARGHSPLAWGPALVSSLVVVAFFAVLTLLMVLDRSFAAETAALVNITIGTLGAAFASVVNFWIGSSQSSRDKDRMVQSMQAASTAQMQHAFGALRDMAGTLPAPEEPEAPPAEERFDRCLEVVLAKEGGFVDDPRDPGGATNMGITLATLRAFREAEVSAQDVRDLTRSEAREIYRARYWTPMRCADLPAGVDLTVFDFGVNAGPSRAVRLLQRAVGVTADGSVGPITLAAARALPPAGLVDSLAEARLAYYRGLDGYAAFGRGWTARVEAVRRAGREMARKSATEPMRG
ncbi:hypothetical protein LPC08_18180 [Roseomonas sp. OT10]|uniref:glycosyl hydrolase 108 family protein n=1 Tax=Roseomonas cutis TaxID=2897332 RepID=UPI001E39AFBD|nr:glycosyl hydrolase 108 family protein [Roseomonas sp. OT10]UFN47926.1 hypothetical protein LPC08_18180 [Roseomonas sp. OT10]